MEKSKTLAVLSFVFGIMFWIPLLNLIFGSLAIILGINSLLKIRKEPDKYDGRWYAIAGIVLGSLPIVLSIIGLGMCLSGFKDICKNMGLAFLT